MKIVQFTQPGPPEVPKYIDAPVPEPKAGEVLVRARSIGVGMPDTRIRAGTYPWMPSLPCIPGTEMGGVIEKVGPGVTLAEGGRSGDSVGARALAARRLLCRIHRNAGARNLRLAPARLVRRGGKPCQLSGRLSPAA